MADNTTINAGSGGDTIATDDIAGVKHQLVKVEYGAADSATQVDASHGLPTAAGYYEVSGSASANNTDVINQDVSGYRSVSVQLTGTWNMTVNFQCSNDATNWV